MIESLSNYAYSIICSSFLLNIIQMILPEGENRKYIMFVCSVIVTIILINPIINFLNKDIDVSNILIKNEEIYAEVQEENYRKYYSNEIINTYKKNIEEGVAKRLEEAGYKVHQIECEYDEVTMEPKYLKLTIESDNGRVQPVRIEVSSSNSVINEKLSPFEEMKIKNMLKEIYGIEKVDINLSANS